jgi:uncharacterized protein
LRHIDEQGLADIAVGAAILGTGGGGDPYIGTLLAKAAIREFGPVEIVELDEVPEDAFVIPSAMMGAPTVMVEKLPSGREIENAFFKLEKHLGQKATHTMPIEIGGLNSVIPFCLAARLRLPLIDADMMGRAFPELQMCIPTLYGVSAAPMAIADDKGNASIIDAIDNRWTERLARSHTIDMGCAALIGLYPLTAGRFKDCTIPGTLKLAEELGALVRETREAHGDPIGAVLERLSGFRLFNGKVTDVHRRTESGFARAEVRIDGLGQDEGSTLMLETQNEHLVARRGDEVLASVPDLIIVLDSENGQPITTEDLRYGFRVTVVAVPCDPRWRTEAGLEIVGPRYFGYDFDYVPIEDRMGEAVS